MDKKYWKLRKNKMALQYYERTLRIYDKIKGNNHIDSAVAINNTGLIYWSQG